MTIETTAPAEVAEKSLREELQEQFTAASAADDAATATGHVEETATEAQARARDAQGRFAGKSNATDATIVDPAQRAPAGTVGTAQATDAAQTAAADSQAAVAAAATAIPPPQNLKPELRAAWDAAPPELRKYIADREAEVHKGFTRMDEERQFGKTLRDVIQPYMPLITSQGGDPASAVKSLLNTAYIFTAGTPAQKIQALQSVAQQYGIPLDQATQFQPQQRIDPTVAALQQQVQQLTQSRQQEEQAREQQAQHEIHTTISAFAASPGHEFFEQVKPHMAALLNAELAKDMQDAYEQAVWARPDLRQTVLAAQQQTAAQTVAQQAAARSEAAKKAAGSVRGAPGAVVPVGAPERSLREELRANLRSASH